MKIWARIFEEFYLLEEVDLSLNSPTFDDVREIGALAGVHGTLRLLNLSSIGASNNEGFGGLVQDFVGLITFSTSLRQVHISCKDIQETKERENILVGIRKTILPKTEKSVLNNLVYFVIFVCYTRLCQFL